jgi:hypothetical protein
MLKLKLILFFVLSVVLFATAETVAFYPFNEKSPGNDVETILNSIDSRVHSGYAERVEEGAMPSYSSDVPGIWIYSGSSFNSVLSSDINSIDFKPLSGVADSGGLVTLEKLSTAISAFDEGTIEFFAKSDANQSWRNIITLNGGQQFKVCFNGKNVTWQNYWKYNIDGSYASKVAPESSGIWLHIAFVWSKSNNTATNFLDYAFGGTEYLTNTTTTVTKHVWLGGSSKDRPHECMNGKICAFRVSNRILAPEEMMRVSYFPLHDEHITVSKDGVKSTHASQLNIDKGYRLKVRGFALSAGKVIYGDQVVAPGLYTGADGVANAIKVDWIDGNGTLEVRDPSADTSSWRNTNGGKWNDNANWSAGVPAGNYQAYINLISINPYTVTVDTEVDAPSSIELEGLNSERRITLDISKNGVFKLKDDSLTIKDGGVLKLSGGHFYATNSLVDVHPGGRILVADGTFAYTNTTKKNFILQNDATLEMTGGEMHIGRVSEASNFRYKSKVSLSGNAKLVIADNTYFKADAIFSDNSCLETCIGKGNSFYFASDENAQPSITTFKDNASINFAQGNAVLYVGSGKDSSILNLESSGKTIVPYGILVGSEALSVLNIRNGYYLQGNGNLNAIGHRYSASRNGEVNVFNGAFVQFSSAQWSDCLYGLSVGDTKKVTGTGTARGVLNIYGDGVVSNLTSNTRDKGAGVYLRVGSGKDATGIINQMGGEVYHDSNLQALIGVFGGNGEWNMSQGAKTTILADVYIGGAVTNELMGFNGVGGSSSKSPWNGGENFAKAYDAFAPAKGILNVENGTFFTPSNLFVSVVGEGTLQVGSDGVVLAKNVTLSNTVCNVDGVETVSNSTLRIAFGAGKAGCITVAEKFTVSNGSRLVLDFSNFVDDGITTMIPLVTYAAREGFFADEDIEIINNPPAIGALVKDVSYKGKMGLWYSLSRGTMIFIR